ncbi:MAG: DUF4388 domain-containing protein [Planctomycetes bacterium]|nr:DUF4388 domain-containing protein [Planctomycetota bacterium]
MSFQGDVAGLGLGELLQGLARGGRAGVLTLLTTGRTVRVGVRDGQLFLLPEEHEGSDGWHTRTQRAWAARNEANPQAHLQAHLQAQRMREIAQASRLEAMFGMLDASGVHFRFDAGPIPELEAQAEHAPTQQPGAAHERPSAILGPAISVEYILLEHARISDELSAQPHAHAIDAHFVPRRRGDEPPQRTLEHIWNECDGSSSVAEISDRLGWPLRQARTSLCALHGLGAMRFADARELLALAHHELQSGQTARAASRLAGWCRLAHGGPASQGDAELLLDHWERGTLAPALGAMEPRRARALLARLDGATHDPIRSVQRWMELRRAHEHDFVTEFAALRRAQRCGEETLRPPMADLLRVARRFQDRGQTERAAAMLRSAVMRDGASVAARLEIGQRLMAVGKFDEGAGWVIDACHTLADAGQHDRAVAALKPILQLLPSQREARALYSSSFGRTAKGRRARRNTLAALSTALVLSLAGVAHVRRSEDFERRLELVREQLDRPEAALAELDSLFGKTSDGRVESLREQLRSRIRHRQLAARQAWSARFQDCHLECTGGDPVLGLRNALEMPPIPAGPALDGEVPPRLAELLESLVTRLQDLSIASRENTVAVEAAHAEQRLSRLIADLLAVLQSTPPNDELQEFEQTLRSLQLTLDTRSRERAALREKELQAQALAHLDALFAAGRAHAAAGDLQRAVECFDTFEAAPGGAELAALLRREIDAVRDHHESVLAARELAEAGRHAEAIARLSPACPRPAEHLLPCRIESLPSGAHVRLSNGTLRTTPFVLECAPLERVAGRVELAGYETTALVLDGPADRQIVLSRTPSAHWSARTRVEALPVSVDDCHIVCDREGRVARLFADGRERWAVRLKSAAGIRHAPVFLPRRPGSLLVVDELGAVWILATHDGSVEGPLELGSAPASGPRPSARGVELRLEDGRELHWQGELTPSTEQGLDAPQPAARVLESGFACLRRSIESGHALSSPWNQGTLDVTLTHYVLRRADGTTLFAMARTGDWNYVAFEAPNARAPRGRAWLSDASGLKAFDL